MDPELLFLDEPTAGLDPIIAAGFDELVLRLKALLGLTVMVTHDLDSLWRIADRVADWAMERSWHRHDAGVVGFDDPLIREYFHGPRGRAAEGQHG
jgi:phospholipid/cholesterol/gamma-HCH transport system ATP-binding protein